LSTNSNVCFYSKNKPIFSEIKDKMGNFIFFSPSTNPDKKENEDEWWQI